MRRASGVVLGTPYLPPCAMCPPPPPGHVGHRAREALARVVLGLRPDLPAGIQAGVRQAVLQGAHEAHQLAPLLENAPDEPGRRGLPVGARDAHHAPFIETRGQFSLPYEFSGAPGKGLCKFPSCLDPRTDHYQISLAGPTCLRGRPGMTGNLFRHAREGLGRGRIVESDHPALLQRQLCGSPTTPAHPQDRNFLTSEIHFVKVS